jgi:hypothetical protein
LCAPAPSRSETCRKSARIMEILQLYSGESTHHLSMASLSSKMQRTVAIHSLHQKNDQECNRSVYFSSTREQAEFKVLQTWQ